MADLLAESRASQDRVKDITGRLKRGRPRRVQHPVANNERGQPKTDLPR